MQKIKEKLLIILFCLTLLLMPLLYTALPVMQISHAERRLLAQLPLFNTANIFNGSYMAKLEKYALDHFPGRDSWRTFKAFLRLKVFRQLDNNGLRAVDGSIYQLQTLNEESASQTLAKIKRVIEDLPESSNIYLSLIPDKGYYLDRAGRLPGFDFDRLEEMASQAGLGEYISIKDVLGLDSYYKTDLHWQQQELALLVERLLAKMQPDISSKGHWPYSRQDHYPFYGGYSGQFALPGPADKLTVLLNSSISQSKAEYLDPATRTFKPGLMYDPDLFLSIDPYNIFLGGPQAVVRLSNQEALTDRQLFIFRDSFASALAPLLTEYYANITLLDLRYIDSGSVSQLIEFPEEADVLFLYGSLVMNDSTLFMVR